jgi:hypothetical protein
MVPIEQLVHDGDERAGYISICQSDDPLSGSGSRRGSLLTLPPPEEDEQTPTTTASLFLTNILERRKELAMEMETTAFVDAPCVPFSLLFAHQTVPTREGEQTGGAETETQTSLDGIVTTDSEEDEDVDK